MKDKEQVECCYCDRIATTSLAINNAQVCEKMSCIEDRKPVPSKSFRNCVGCKSEYDLRQKKFGFHWECNGCGKVGSDAKTPRLGGIMEYSHKTAPTIKIMSLGDAQEIKRKTDRKGGQGIIVGLAERR